MTVITKAIGEKKVADNLEQPLVIEVPTVSRIIHNLKLIKNSLNYYSFEFP